jgi:hypothetical protein
VGRYMLGAVSRCCQRVVLAAELGRFAADADTAPGFRERLHNRCTPERCPNPGVVAMEHVATQGQVALMFQSYHRASKCQYEISRAVSVIVEAQASHLSLQVPCQMALGMIRRFLVIIVYFSNRHGARGVH